MMSGHHLSDVSIMPLYVNEQFAQNVTSELTKHCQNKNMSNTVKSLCQSQEPVLGVKGHS